jgi:protein TonB
MADKPTQRRLVLKIGGMLVAAVLILVFVSFVRLMMASKTSKPDRKVQVVQIIRPPPPPPPDQPPPPPPPEKTEEQLPKDEPEPPPDQPQQAPDQPLGVDVEGSAGGDAFGLAARRGGSDLLGGTGTAPFAWYTNRLTDAIRERLASVDCARSAKGSLSFHLLLEASGRIKQVQLSSSTGNPRLDSCIDAALTSMPPMSDPLPLGMPEQVNLKIVSRI